MTPEAATARTPGPLGLLADELAACVSCGLCLPHCPTFRVTGDESRSPRGRIATMRAVEDGVLDVDDAVVDAFSSCVQCRACETACPSGVRFGHLMEDTRAALVDRTTPWWQRAGLRLLAVPAAVRAASLLAAVGQRIGIVPSARLGLPARLPLRRPRLTESPPVGPDGETVWLFTGCVMDAWQRDVHVAAARLVAATGRGVALPARGGGCCGALAGHAGVAAEARRRATATMASMPGEASILVDSAGCGAAMQEYGQLLGTDDARRFSARVVDVNRWLADHLDELPPPRPGASRPTVAVQDPCHLRHVQRDHDGVRRLLSRYADLVELDDDGACCGAGGAYSAQQPDLADAIRARKLDAIARTGAECTVSANPGCLAHLGRAGIAVVHPVSVASAAVGMGEEDGRAR